MNEPAAKPICVLVVDLFFRSKIRTVAEAAGATVRFARNFDELQNLLSQAGGQANVIIDLNDHSLRPLEILPHLVQSGSRVLGFLSHVDVATANAAREAGCTVLPRSKFVENLPAILIGDFSG
ncbi:MAG: hypothetical protein ONB46_15140 [candidate division KSB1 bacterium]|nr:hypothetical protein [candidate division KSB1 bacterium]MDZ7366976.1 hypothetical protein [candidate division KSB1 bacterium]MDZ7406819.1 hypothetical protein [candidate division KSB1 bacterium]